MCRAAFLPWPTPTVTVRSLGHHVAAGEHARAAGHHRRATPRTVPSRLNSTPGTSRRNAVSVSWPSARITVSAASVSKLPGRLREAGLVELHHLDGQLRAVEGGDRAQPVDAHALALGFLGLLLVGGHLGPGPPVDDERLVRAQPAGDPGRVHRGVAAAVDGDAAADHRRSPDATLRRNDTASTIRPASRAGMSTRLDRCAPTATNTASKPPSRRSAARSVDPVSAGDPSRRARRSARSRRRARRAAAGRRGCRSASSRRARRRRPGSPPRGRSRARW